MAEALKNLEKCVLLWSLRPKFEEQILLQMGTCMLLRGGWVRKHQVSVLLSHNPAFASCHFQTSLHHHGLKYVSYQTLMTPMYWGATCRHLASLSEYPCSIGAACPSSRPLSQFSKKRSSLKAWCLPSCIEWKTSLSCVETTDWQDSEWISLRTMETK